MKWSEPILLQYSFQFGVKRRTAVARLGFPRQVADDEWACPFQLEGLKDGRIRLARGADGLQALTIAVTAIRKSLDRAIQISPDVEPHEFVFPVSCLFHLG